MANTIEYIFSLQDKISAKISNITITSDRMLDKFAELERKNTSVNKTFNETGRTLGALREKITALQAEREWIPAENIEGIRAYNHEIKALNKEINKLESLNGGKLKKWGKEAFAALPGSNLMSNPLVAIGAAVGFSGKSAMNFDESMAQVNITAQLEGKSLDALKDDLKKIAKDNKTDILVSPVGFEKINSQLNDVDLSLSILDASLKGSKAGFTDLDTVSGALAQTLSIVGKENTSAMEVLDTFFAAKRVGAGEFADFARYMPNLIAGASNLGIAYKEVAGTFAYMTGKGQSAERAAVLMENAFSVLGRVDVRSKMEKAGIKVFDEQGKIRGIVDIFSDLQRVLGALNDEQKSSLLEKLGLVDKEAKNAFAIMTSDVIKLKESMQDVTEASGETDKALKYSKNSIQKATEVWSQFKNIGVSLGELILPVINIGLDTASLILSGLCTVVDTINNLCSCWFDQLQNGNPLIWGITAAVTALSVALLVNYARIHSLWLLTKAKVLWDGIQAGTTWLLTGATWALNAAFLACPLTWIVAAIGAVVAVIVYCWNHFERFRKIVLGTWEVLKEFGHVLIDVVVTPFKQVLGGISSVCSAMVSLIKGNFKEAATEAKQGFKDIGKGALQLNPISIGASVINNGQWNSAWEKGQQKGADSWLASQGKNDKLNPVEIIPESVTPISVDFDTLMKKLAKTKSGSKTKKVLNLNDKVQNYSETSEYTAITKKIAPVTVSLSPTNSLIAGTTNKIIPAVGTKVNDGTQEYNTEKQNLLQDIMMNVRKIAAVATIPVALSVAAPASGMNAPTGQGLAQPGKTVQVDRVCEQIVINVQNTDNKGLNTIREEVIQVLKEVFEA